MRIGGRELERELGRGGAGVVHAATDADGTPLAVKILAEGDAGAFAREVRLHAGLVHPGIVRVVDHGVDEGRPWVAMERVDGGSLADRLAERRQVVAGTFDLDTPQVPAGGDELLRLALAVCPALAWLHGEGLVHADLKPANVLIRSSGEPVLADLGLSRAALGRIQVEDRVRGSLGYVSPEQARGEPIDARADLFSLGAILFEVLTGVPPTDPANPGEALRALERPPDPPSSRVEGVPPRLDALVLALLDRDRAHRPGSAHRVAEELAAVLGVAPPTTDTRPPLFVAPLIGRDRPLDEVLAATRAALAGGGLAVVRGAPGSGTTRLAAEVARRLRQEGVIVAGASTRSGGRGLTLVRSLVARVAAVTHTPDPSQETSAETAPTADLAGLGHRLARAWSAAAARRPLLVVVDDLDRADRASAEVLGHVLGELLAAPARVAFLATAGPGAHPAAAGSPEPDAVGGPVEGLLAAARPTRLAALSADDTARIGAAILGVDRLPRSLDQAVRERALGSPLLVREWISTAVADGAVRFGPGGWAPTTEPGTPTTLGGLIDTRLDHLRPEAWALVGAAWRLEEAATEERLMALDADAVRDALRLRLLERDADGIRVLHPEIGHRALARLGPERSSALHRRLAERFGDAVPAALVAGWWEAAGDRERAVEGWERAAAQAAGEHPPSALLALWRAAELSTDPTRWRRVLTLAIDLDDTPALAACARAFAGEELELELIAAARAREGGDAAAQADHAARAARSHDPELRRQALSLRVAALRRLGAPREAIAAEADGDLFAEATLAWDAERWDEAAGRFAELEARYLAEGDLTRGLRATGNRAACLYRAGRTVEAHETTLAALWLARRAGMREVESQQWMTLALGWELDGQAAPALGAAGAALAIAVALGSLHLARRAVQLQVEVLDGPPAWAAAEVLVALGGSDRRAWVAARTGRSEPLPDVGHGGSGDFADPELRAEWLEIRYARTGAGREEAVEAWRSVGIVPGATFALARLGVTSAPLLPDPPPTLVAVWPTDLGSLNAAAVRRFSSIAPADHDSIASRAE